MSAEPLESFDSPRIRQLGRMLDLDASAETDTWQRGDFSAILEHQLEVPLETELSGIDSRIGSNLEEWRRQSEYPLERFCDLFAHPQPPVELLNTVKRFAKRARNSARGFLPDEVATVLYFACIAVGVMRCGTRISRMDEEKLRRGVAWAAGQEWIDTLIQGIFQEAAASLASENRGAGSEV